MHKHTQSQIRNVEITLLKPRDLLWYTVSAVRLLYQWNKFESHSKQTGFYLITLHSARQMVNQ